MLGGSAPEIRIRVRVVELDNITRGIKNVNTQLEGFANSLGMNFRRVNNELKQTRGFFEGFGTMLRTQAKLIAGFVAIRTVSDAVSGVAASFIEFDRVLAQVRAITRASDADMAVLANTLKKTASISTLSFTELGEAAKVLGQAGLNAQQVANSLEAVVKLAVATGSNVGDVAQLLTTAIKVFNVNAKDSTKIANTFALAINKSKLTLDSLRIAFAYVAPIAAQTGETIESLTSYMMVLADKGLQASKIGTGLRQVYAALMKPSTRLLETFQKLGITYDDVNLSAKNLIDVVEVLAKKGVSLQDIFYSMGVRSATGFAYLIDSIEQIKAKQSILKEQGALLEMYKTRLGAVEAKFKLLRNQVAVLAANLRGDLRPVLIQIYQSLFLFVKGLAEVGKALKDNGAYFTAFGGILAMLIPGLGTTAKTLIVLAGALGTAASQLGIINNNLITTTDLVYGLSAAFSLLLPGPWKWIGVGISGVLFLINKLHKDTSIMSKDSKEKLVELGETLKSVQVAAAGKDLTQNFFIALNANLKKLRKDFPQLAKELGEEQVESLSIAFNEDVAKDWAKKYAYNVSKVEDTMVKTLENARKKVEDKLNKMITARKGLTGAKEEELFTGAGYNAPTKKELNQAKKNYEVLNNLTKAMIAVVNKHKEELQTIKAETEARAKYKQSIRDIITNLKEEKDQTKVNLGALKSSADYRKAMAKQLDNLTLITKRFIAEHKSVIEVEGDTGEVFLKGATTVGEYQRAVASTINTIQRLINNEEALMKTENAKINKQYKSFLDKFNNLMALAQEAEAPKGETKIETFRRLAEAKREAMVKAADVGNWREVLKIANDIVDSTTKMASSNKEFAKTLSPHSLPRYLEMAKRYAKTATENMKEENLAKVTELENMLKSAFVNVGGAIDKNIVAKINGIAIQTSGLWKQLKVQWNEGFKTKVNLDHSEIDSYVDKLKKNPLIIPAKIKIEKPKETTAKTGTETTTTTSSSEEGKHFGGVIKKFAEGGWLPGYGGGDKIKILAEAGEFVHPKEAVAYYGKSFMEALRHRAIPAEKIRELQSNIVNNSSSQIVNQQHTTISLNMPTDSKKLSVRSRRLLDELSDELSLAIARGELI